MLSILDKSFTMLEDKTIELINAKLLQKNRTNAYNDLKNAFEKCVELYHKEEEITK